MELRRHTRLFDRIAPIYKLFFRWQVRSYSSIIFRHRNLILAKPDETILDVGCGTGAFGAALTRFGYPVIGADLAGAMVRQGVRENLYCIHANALGGLPFRDSTFPTVTAAYMAHGLSSQLRMALYPELARVSQGQVIFHDWGQARNPLTDLVEWAEGGDYFNFIRQGLNEMRDHFSGVDVISVGTQQNWYICRV
jgi:SAM-dependent methyltransferase